MMVARVWQCAGFESHRIELYTDSDDPDIALKATCIPISEIRCELCNGILDDRPFHRAIRRKNRVIPQY
jgi:hypothetical protein